MLGEDLRQLGVPWLGDLAVVLSLFLPLLPLLALLRLADQLLPPAESPRRTLPWPWLLRQAAGLVVLEVLLLLGGIGLIQSLSWAVGQIAPPGRAW